MGGIYSRAQLVNVWLGQDEAGTAARAKKAMKKVCSDPDTGQKILGIRLQLTLGASRPALSRGDWHSLESFYSSKWFTRTWVVQEALLNENCIVYKGRKAVHLHWVLRATISAPIGSHYPIEVGKFSADARAGWDNAMTMHVMNYDAPAAGGSLRLSKILNLTSEFEARDVLDKVYGFLGLVDAQIMQNIGVDYNRKVADVFTSASRLAIERDQSLTILSSTYSRRAPALDVVEDALPSWVVPCHWKRLTWPLEIGRHPGLLKDKSEFFGYEKVDDAIVLKVRGLMLGEIATDLIVLIDEPRGWHSKEYVDSFLQSFCTIWDLAR